MNAKPGPSPDPAADDGTGNDGTEQPVILGPPSTSPSLLTARSTPLNGMRSDRRKPLKPREMRG
jgi:hypothetical protein